MFSFFKKEENRIKDIAEQVLALEDTYKKLTDEDLKNQTENFKNRLENGSTLESLMVEAFATVREMTRRAEGILLHKEQIMGAVVLFEGNLAELKTGEGKTNTAVCAVYLCALNGKGVHVVTVNEYLAQRDAEWLKPIYEGLGLTVAVNLTGMTKEQKKAAYDCDVVYTTNSELGFDYLRDNMVIDANDRCQRGLHTVIIDEADSVLIDEARTPLIISGGAKQTADLYRDADKFVKSLIKPTYKYDKAEHKRVCVRGDYSVDEKTRQISLTETGQIKAEQWFGLKNLYGAGHTQLVHHINQALKANYVFTKDVEYIVNSDDKVLIVDQSTGRVMPGRAYSDGLHQALEAKEGVKINEETATLATITYQNFFRLYDKIAGMSGTAKTEEEEFLNTYNMQVEVIPTHKPMIRIDYPDLIYGTKKAKYKAIVEEVKRVNQTGQPILLGTPSVEVSEILHNMLKEAKIDHQVLNAKNHAKEAEIISGAGQKGVVTLATNMAGRGTDIKLGKGVRELGGLHVIGAERHEARRIDNQLRGRAGRQGDPGTSRFYVSLEDDLMVRFGTDRFKGMFSTDSDEALESKQITKVITQAQIRVEGMNFDSRKLLLDYDDVLRRQRDIIYQQRNKLLDNVEVHEMVHRILNETMEQAVYVSSERNKVDIDFLMSNLEKVLRKENMPDKAIFEHKTIRECTTYLQDLVWRTYEGITSGHEGYADIERAIVLRNIDRNWVEHIDKMDKLKGAIYLRSYAQHHPLQQYVQEGYEMFSDMNETINREIAFMLLKIRKQV